MPIYCDLCGLEVGKPFVFTEQGEEKIFCCEACLGIYRLLYEDEEPEDD